jgi:hypothetical protein
LLTPAEIHDSYLRKPLNASGHPAKTTFLVRVGIENPCNLARRRKEIPMDKGVVIGQENAESGMRVVPSDDSVIREFFVLYFIDVFPRVLRERDVGSRLFGIEPRDGSLYFDDAFTILAY